MKKSTQRHHRNRTLISSFLVSKRRMIFHWRAICSPRIAIPPAPIRTIEVCRPYHSRKLLVKAEKRLFHIAVVSKKNRSTRKKAATGVTGFDTCAS